MDTLTFHAVWTVFMLVTFVTLIFWVMSGKQKKAFDEASQLPLTGDSDLETSTSLSGDNYHE